ncbi:hypothetical protein ACQY1Y_10985 [Microcystis ichthyoblabe FBCC-A1114]
MAITFGRSNFFGDFDEEECDRFWKEQFFGMEVIKLKLIRINISTMTNLMNRNKVIIKRIYHPVIANSKFKQTALN